MLCCVVTAESRDGGLS